MFANPKIAEEYRDLVLAIKQHDLSYYQEDAPSVSDAEYDALRRRVEEMEASLSLSCDKG